MSSFFHLDWCYSFRWFHPRFPARGLLYLDYNGYNSGFQSLRCSVIYIKSRSTIELHITSRMHSAARKGNQPPPPHVQAIASSWKLLVAFSLFSSLGSSQQTCVVSNYLAVATTRQLKAISRPVIWTNKPSDVDSYTVPTAVSYFRANNQPNVSSHTPVSRGSQAEGSCTNQDWCYMQNNNQDWNAWVCIETISRRKLSAKVTACLWWQPQASCQQLTDELLTPAKNSCHLLCLPWHFVSSRQSDIIRWQRLKASSAWYAYSLYLFI